MLLALAYRAGPLEAQVAPTGAHGDLRHQRALDVGPVQIELLPAEPVRPPMANRHQLGAKYVPVKSVRPLLIGDVDHADAVLPVHRLLPVRPLLALVQ